MRVAYIDIETTGVSRSEDTIVEIGMLIPGVCQHQSLVKPYGDPERWENGQRIHGITIEEAEKKGNEVHWVLNECKIALKVYKVDAICGHNLKRFDLPRIEDRCPDFWDGQVIDTMILAKDSDQFESCSLERLVDHFEIENKQAHRALSDCYATYELHKRL